MRLAELTLKSAAVREFAETCPISPRSRSRSWSRRALPAAPARHPALNALPPHSWPGNLA